MKSAVEDRLEKEHEGVAFVRNLKWFWGGVAVSVLALADGRAALAAGRCGGRPLPLRLERRLVGCPPGSELGPGQGRHRGARRAGEDQHRFSRLGFLLPFFIVGGFAPVVIFLNASSPGLYAFAGGALVLVIMGFIFHRLLRAPTLSGRKLLDQVEGFRMYMTTAEEERLKVLHPPEKTPELFERYLPYALALDCENEWNAKFASVLAAAAAAGLATTPSWYLGSNWNTGDMGSFTNSVGSSLATAASAASTPPGSSSSSGGGFSGGGGSSGGGGGGGGGSGW